MRVGRKVTGNNRWRSYGVALLSTALALEIVLLLDPLIDPTPISLFFVAVMVSAWYGGWRPGLVATILSTLAVNYFLIEPYYSLKTPDLGTLLHLGIFVMAALASGGLNESRRIALHQEQQLRAVSEAAQSEAQAAKERLETVLSSINDGFYVLDRNWHYTYVSDRYCEMAGMPREALLGQNIWQVFPDAADTELYLQLQRVMTEQTPVQFEYLYSPWNRWYEHRVYPSADTLTVFVAEISERKQAEIALSHSEARFRRIFDCNMVPMGIWNSSGGILHANDALLDLVGYTRQELEAGQINWQAITPPEWLPVDKRALIEITTRGFCTPFEKEYIHKQGHLIPILIGGASFLDDPESGVFFAIDLSDRQQAEKALRQSEEQLRLASEGANLGLWHWDVATDTLTWTDRCKALFGLPSDTQMSYQVFLNTLHPEDRQRICEMRPLLESGQLEPHEIEYRVVWPDGTVHWIAARGHATYDAEGKPISSMGIALDITERKQAEEALRRSEERLRLAMEGAQMGTWDIDLIDGKAIWSELHFTMLGYEPTPTGEATETMWNSRIHPDDLERVIQEWQQSRRERRLYQAEYRVIRADNQQISWLAALGSFTYNQNGEAIRSIGVLFDISDRKQAEVALQQREAELSLVTNAVPALISFVDADQCYRFNNRGYEEWFGHPATEIYGKHLKEVLGEAAYEEIRPYVEQVLAGQPVTFESQVPYKDGGTRYISAMYVPRFNREGTVEGFVALVSDISEQQAALRERKQIEKALSVAIERFELAANAVNCLVYEWNIEQNIVERSEGLTRILGYAAEEVDGSADWWFELYHPEDKQRVQDELVLAWEIGDRFSLEYRVRHKNGHYVHLLDQAIVVQRDANGKPTRQIGSTIDISEQQAALQERKQAEVALRQSEERYRCLAELIPQLVWTADAEGVLIDVNQRWSTFTGLTLAQAQTEGWEAVVHPDDVQILNQNWAIAQQNGTYYQAEGRMRRADGMYRWHLHQAVALKNEEGQLIKWFGTATDIEDQKQLEQQRIHLLQQEQAAREEAERANRIKDEFLAVLSHELRSPLNPILGWSKLLQNGKLDEARTKQALATIERNAKLQAELIEDLLDVSRILRGKLSLTISPINLASTIRAALETVRLAAEAKSIHLRFTILDEAGEEREQMLESTATYEQSHSLNSQIQTSKFLVSGDSTRLQQVVWNLLSNAVKFTSAGGRVEVRLEKLQIADSRLQMGKDISYAQITVSDNGKGISPDFLPYVFDYFRQEDGATTRKFGGLGLGLAIVRHLVELHGGTIGADSPGEGLGATFTVKLPLMPVQPPRNSKRQALTQSLDLKGIRVLVVDDDTDTRDLIAFLLEQAGATVMAAAAAGEALAALTQYQPDILVSDIGMPEMDGYMLLRQVRALPPERGGLIPAIALTAYAGEFDRQQALSVGFQQHVAKPVEPEGLVSAIATLIGRG